LKLKRWTHFDRVARHEILTMRGCFERGGHSQWFGEKRFDFKLVVVADERE